MVLTKSTVTVQASVSNGAGSTTSSGWIDVTGAYEGTLYMKVINGVTPPTIGVTLKLQRADDNAGTNSMDVAAITHDVAGSSTGYYPIRLPEGCRFIQFVATGNTGQAVTVQAVMDKTTAI